MTEDQKRALINIDLREPSPVSDCLDVIVAFPAAIEHMRETGEQQNFPRTMMSGTDVAFETLDSKDDDAGILFVAAFAQDMLYRGIAGLSILDGYTRCYCATVVRYFFYLLSERNIRTFYILDNTLRDDRYAAILELFELADITTVTPRRDGKDWPTLSQRVNAALETNGHVAYIEPDAEVNHLDAAKALAGEQSCVATLRNLAPEDATFQVVTWPS